MALGAGEYYTDKNHTKVIQGALPPEQKKWLEENLESIITCLPLTPAQKLYLALCKNGMQLQEALASCDLNEGEAAEAQQALEILDKQGEPLVNAGGVVTKITRPSFVGADLQGYDLQGADLSNADLYGADLRHADLRGANLQGADLREAKLKEADLRVAQMQGADLRWADLREAKLKEADLWGAILRGADISGANFQDAKNLQDTYLDLAFYCQDNPPKNLEDALEGVDVKQRPMALTKQEYDHLRNLRDSKDSSFTDELKRLRDVCNTRIDSQQQVDAAVNAAKAKFAWCQPLVSTTVAIMFSQGFDAQTRAAWYSNGAGGNVLQGISNRLEGLNNHLVGRGSR